MKYTQFYLVCIAKATTVLGRQSLCGQVELGRQVTGGANKEELSQLLHLNCGWFGQSWVHLEVEVRHIGVH